MKRAKQRRTHRQVRHLAGESLERRDLLSVELVGSDLRVIGTDADDTARVWVESGLVRAELNGVVSRFNPTSVRSVRFEGLNGDDRFTNSTSLPCTAYGGTGNDSLTGGTGADSLYGGAGNDVLVANAGNDQLYGGDGNDQLQGGDGTDAVRGEAGRDVAYGGFGNDTLRGGDGDDQMYGEAGDDTLYGENQNDYLSGGDGADRVYGDAGNDTLYGGNQNDSLYGGTGDDTAFGGAGNDTLRGEDGNDTLWGEAGSDTARGGNGNDELNGDAGADTLYGDAGHDTLYGGDGNDNLYGGDGNDFLGGGQGTDSLRGEGGHDGLFGGIDGDSSDTLRGGSGNDRFLRRTNRDAESDRGDSDVRLVIRDGSSNWTEREVRNVDQAFGELYSRTGTTRILKDTTADGSLTFVKENSAYDYAGLNEWWEEWNWGAAHMEQHRLIHIRDWDETDRNENWSARLVAIHEIGHNWDSGDEADHHPGGDGYWSDFRREHDRSDSADDYARAYGMDNIHEDFATCLEVAMGYRTTGFPALPSTVLDAKLAALEDFLDAFV